MASDWCTKKAKSGEILFYYNVVTGEQRWPNSSFSKHDCSSVVDSTSGSVPPTCYKQVSYQESSTQTTRQCNVNCTISKEIQGEEQDQTGSSFDTSNRLKLHELCQGINRENTSFSCVKDEVFQPHDLSTNVSPEETADFNPKGKGEVHHSEVSAEPVTFEHQQCMDIVKQEDNSSGNPGDGEPPAELMFSISELLPEYMDLSSVGAKEDDQENGYQKFGSQQCNKCDKVYKRPSVFFRHTRTHLTEDSEGESELHVATDWQPSTEEDLQYNRRKYQYKCRVCSLVFLNSIKLALHLKTHDKVLAIPNSCNLWAPRNSEEISRQSCGCGGPDKSECTKYHKTQTARILSVPPQPSLLLITVQHGKDNEMQIQNYEHLNDVRGRQLNFGCIEGNSKASDLTGSEQNEEDRSRTVELQFKTLPKKANTKYPLKSVKQLASGTSKTNVTSKEIPWKKSKGRLKRLYRCRLCDRMLKSVVFLIRHMESHANGCAKTSAKRTANTSTASNSNDDSVTVAGANTGITDGGLNRSPRRFVPILPRPVVVNETQTCIKQLEAEQPVKSILSENQNSSEQPQEIQGINSYESAGSEMPKHSKESGVNKNTVITDGSLKRSPKKFVPILPRPAVVNETKTCTKQLEAEQPVKSIFSENQNSSEQPQEIQGINSYESAGSEMPKHSKESGVNKNTVITDGSLKRSPKKFVPILPRPVVVNETQTCTKQLEAEQPVKSIFSENQDSSEQPQEKHRRESGELITMSPKTSVKGEPPICIIIHLVDAFGDDGDRKAESGDKVMQTVGESSSAKAKFTYEELSWNAVKTTRVKGIYQCHLCDKILTSSVFLSKHLQSHARGFAKKSLNKPNKKVVAVFPIGQFKKRKVFIPILPKASPNDTIGSTDSSCDQDSTGSQEDIQQLRCPVCNQLHRSGQSLSKHLESHYNNSSTSCQSMDDNTCKVDETSAQKHREPGDPAGEIRVAGNFHCKKFAFKCMLCLQTFLTQAEFDVHRNSHIGENESPKCSAVLQKPGCLEKHLVNIHGKEGSNVTSSKGQLLSQEKLYRCSLCAASFPRDRDLTFHLRRHKDEKPFQCEYSNCDSAFELYEELSKHFKTHSGQKPYRCRKCSKTFARRSYHRAHLRSHISNSYVCKQCNASFLQGSGLTAHIRARHSATIVQV